MDCKDFSPAWLAGIFDGEGTVTIAKNYGLRISIQMVHKPTLDAIADCLNLGKVAAKKNKTGRQQWSYQLSGDNALTFLRLVEPYSITKKDEIDLAIESRAIFPIGRVLVNGRYQRLTDMQRKLRKQYYEQLRQLKRYEYERF